MKVCRIALLVAFLTLCACEDKREDAGKRKIPIRISGRVLSVNGDPIRGVVALEKGRLYSKDYRWGGWVKDGAFSVRLPEEGDYGLHVYATGYIYHPTAIRVEERGENFFKFTVPPNPAPEDAPSLSHIEFRKDEDEGAVLIRLQAKDPNGNLSHQVLAVNPEAGISRMLSPDSFIFPWVKNYPDGEYTATYAPEGRPFNREEWIFLAADNRCYTSPLLQYPFSPDSIMASHAETKDAGGNGFGDLSLPEQGRRIFQDNCAVCHHPDRTETKIGPGLKGLFGRERTPVEGIPVTDENIRRRIENGGDKMPPYSHIEGERQDALLAYLKTL